jgi:hypothetical protein
LEGKGWESSQSYVNVSSRQYPKSARGMGFLAEPHLAWRKDFCLSREFG